MNELIDKFLFELFDGLRDKTTVLFGEFIADAQALAAIFMLLYFWSRKLQNDEWR